MRLPILAILCLSACGGGSSGGGTIDPITELPTVIEPETDPVPTGTASYRGPMTLSFTPVSSTVVNLEGTLGLSVNFDATTDAVTGDASAFETSAGGPVDGRLFLGSGALDDSGAALLMNGQLSGSLRNGDDAFLIFGQLNGEFQGDNQSTLIGNVTGTARQSGLDAAISGDFLGARVP